MCRLLHIEDSDQQADSAALRLCGAQIRTKMTLEIERVRTLADLLTADLSRFDALLLDLTLPDSDSLKTLATLKANANEWPPVLIITLADSDVMRSRAMRECGAQDYIFYHDLIEMPEQAMFAIRKACDRAAYLRSPRAS